MNKRRVFAVSLFAASLSSLYAGAAEQAPLKADGQTAENANATITINLNKGDFVLVAADTGSKGKPQDRQGILPFGASRIDPAAGDGPWTLRATLDAIPAKDGTGAPTWNGSFVLGTKYSNGVDRPALRYDWEFPMSDNRLSPAKSLLAVKSEFADVSADYHKSGLRCYKSQFATGDGESYSVLIFVSSKVDDLKEVVKVPDGWVNWKWDTERFIPLK